MRSLPAGCPHLEDKLKLGTDKVSIKSENDDADINTNGSSARLPPEAKAALRRYVAGLRWGAQIRQGIIQVEDSEGTEEQQPKQNGNGNGNGNAKRRKLNYPTCGECEIELHRPFICLDCAFTGCFVADENNSKGRAHIVQHLRSQGHSFAFDIIHGTLFCGGCNDIVLDATFDTVQQRERGRVASTSKGNVPGPRTSSFAKLPLIDTDSGLPCRSPRGLRNMGATCFMNVIIQAFLHNPLLRNYFLSDRHNTALCAGSRACLACEMDKIFSVFFSNTPDKGPHGPTSFLYCMWIDQSSSELSQAGQHDAHELFISALNGVHAALTSRSLERTRLPSFPYEDGNICNVLFDHYEGSGTGSGSSSEEGTPLVGSVASCPCVVHRTFSGQLQSDVTCQRCGKVNSTKDPMLDLSLDVRPESMRRKDSLADGHDASSKKNKAKNKKDELKKVTSEREGTEEEQHLTICLQRYCSTEKLGNDDYTCSTCGGMSTATKQLSLCRLPPVLCIQLKRFEHNSSAIKIDTRVRFPLVLDMREFSTAVVRNDPASLNPDPEAYLYDLFTVVVHEGSMNTGHYTNFSKWREQWYRFDDDKVTPAKLGDVLGARAYQLCYKRRSLKNVAGR